jgi:hypothetical protein
MSERTPPTWGAITPERPLIILQINNRFGDSDDGHGSGDPMEEAARHGREAARAWREAVPDDLKPYCQLQVELRVRDHETRYRRLQRLLDELEAEAIPVNFQFADPHAWYVFDPAYVDRLTREYPCIQSYTITEIDFEHYDAFNVPRYAISPYARYTMDILDLAAAHGKHLSMPLQGTKWMHLGADALNRPLLDKIAAHGAYVLPVNEHIGPQHLPRQTSVWGIWMAGLTTNWGVEPQAWWFENGRMITPGVFGQYQASNTRIMPPPLYRAMILQGAMLGATVYQFEPFWDLFDYDNSACWREVIVPTLREVVQRKLIPTRAQLLDQVKVAYQYKTADSINAYHDILRDVDWIHDEGHLARAAYGVWQRYLQHELIPNKSRCFFLPLLPPSTPAAALAGYDKVIQTGECDSEAAYEALLHAHYPARDTGTAFTASVNGHTYVMQTHENLYERQDYRVSLPRRVRGLVATWRDAGLQLAWDADPGATAYHVCRCEEALSDPMPVLGTSATADFLDTTARQGVRYVYTVLAATTSREVISGHVNYLDYLVFSESVSTEAEFALVWDNGRTETRPVPEPVDTRPASQTVYPTFEGAAGAHRAVAESIVARIDAFKAAYDAADWRGVAALYAADYSDSNGYHREYAVRAWRWWFFRCNSFCYLRQIRHWDFSGFADTGLVRVRLFSLARAGRRDDAPFASGYDGSVRIPRTADEEVVFTWRQDQDGAWRIVHTDPGFPNFGEMLWCSRGTDNTRVKLTPGKDGEPEYFDDPAKTNLIPHEDDWMPPA